jgi:NOL1/NOP2/fmu family ribosome biogenesis protein
MKGSFLNKKEIKKVLKLLETQWGFVGTLDYVWFQSNKRNLYIVNRDFAILEGELRINTLGMYFGEITQKGALRLSIEGAQMVAEHATKQVLELSADQVNEWMYGKDVAVDESLQGFHIVKRGIDVLGCGSCKEGTLHNHVPKSRRIRTLDMPT